MKSKDIESAYGRYYLDCAPGKNGWSSNYEMRRYFVGNMELHPTVQMYWRPKILGEIEKSFSQLAIDLLELLNDNKINNKDKGQLIIKKFQKLIPMYTGELNPVWESLEKAINYIEKEK